MALEPYTTGESVRALLGVSTAELPDATLQSDIYAIQLRRALLVFNLPSQWQDDETLADQVRVFSTYSVARLILPAFGLIAVRSLTDGDAAFQRFSTGISALASSIEVGYERERGALASMTGAVISLTDPSGARVGLAVSKPSYDPVTGVTNAGAV